MAYFDAINLALDDPTVLALSKALDSPTMGEITRKGFTDGWASLGADTIDKMKDKLRELRTKMDTDNEYFKEVYNWTFDWAKPVGQKGIPHETATEWWRLLLAGRFQGHLDYWIDFINTKYKKTISRDTWKMLHEFIPYATIQDPTLTKFDEMSSWPSVIDGYVEYYQNLSK
ncbi:hypothetical protein AA313_de0207940 [Arthrobotrys entomopaga]|nr:hypothetical protein AA313_de0207940 [Arthrobotrys entomopaga]